MNLFIGFDEVGRIRLCKSDASLFVELPTCVTGIMFCPYCYC